MFRSKFHHQKPDLERLNLQNKYLWVYLGQTTYINRQGEGYILV